MPSTSSMHIDNNILLITNASKFHLPVRVYTGFLDVSMLPTFRILTLPIFCVFSYYYAIILYRYILKFCHFLSSTSWCHPSSVSTFQITGFHPSQRPSLIMSQLNPSLTACT